MELLEKLFEHSGNLMDIGGTISHQTWFITKESLRSIYQEGGQFENIDLPKIDSTIDGIIDVYWKVENFHILISFSGNEPSDGEYSIMNLEGDHTVEGQFSVENFLIDFNTFLTGK